MQHFWNFVGLKYFLNGSGDKVHVKMSNILRSFESNNYSMLLQNKKTKSSADMRYRRQTLQN